MRLNFNQLQNLLGQRKNSLNLEGLNVTNEIKEITLRGTILGFVITAIFTAANVYLGLKVGMTVASSIPAAVISMGLLRNFKGSNILENNLVQTQASSAGTLTSIIYVLPGLLMVGFWSHFQFWTTFLLCSLGGVLGVLFSIPLRNVLIVQSQLPYPEGVAAASILMAGDKSSSRDIGLIFSGGILAATVNFMTEALKIFVDKAGLWFNIKSAIFQIPFGFSLALVGAGYLIGIGVSTVMLVGVAFNWGVLVPIMTSLNPIDPSTFHSISEYASKLWYSRTRMIGVGTLGVGAIWTLVSLSKPLFQSVILTSRRVSGIADSSFGPVKPTLEDIAPRYILVLIAIMMMLLIATFYYIISPHVMNFSWMIVLILASVFLSVIFGFLVSATCGYMAGLLGTSSSPISSLAILAVLIISGVLMTLWHLGLSKVSPELKPFLIALSIFSTSVVVSIAGIANDNLQDLKTGQLVGASPANQEWVLIFGCIGGALVTAPVLDMLYSAYGFQGGFMPREGMDPSAALAAPQATLISVLAKGMFSHDLDWQDLNIGIMLGVIVMIIDKLVQKLSHNKLAFPPLAFGMGIYLPPQAIMPMFFGSLIATLTLKQLKGTDQDKKDKKKFADLIKHKGVLFSSGLIVGESLMGIVIAMIILFSVSRGGSAEPLALHLNGILVNILTVFAFGFSLYYFYKKIKPEQEDH